MKFLIISILSCSCCWAADVLCPIKEIDFGFGSPVSHRLKIEKSIQGVGSMKLFFLKKGEEIIIPKNHCEDLDDYELTKPYFFRSRGNMITIDFYKKGGTGKEGTKIRFVVKDGKYLYRRLVIPREGKPPLYKVRKIK